MSDEPERPKPKITLAEVIDKSDEWADRIIRYGKAFGILASVATAIAAALVFYRLHIAGIVVQLFEPILQVGLVVIMAFTSTKLLTTLADYSFEERLHNFDKARFKRYLGLIVFYAAVQAFCTLLAVAFMVNAFITLYSAAVWTPKVVWQTVNWTVVCVEITTIELSMLFSILLYSYILTHSVMDLIAEMVKVEGMFAEADKATSKNLEKIVEVLEKVVNATNPAERLVLELQEPEPPPEEPIKPKRKSKSK